PYVDRVPVAPVGRLPAIVVDDRTDELDIEPIGVAVKRDPAIVNHEVHIAVVVAVVDDIAGSVRPRHSLVAGLETDSAAIGMRVIQLEPPEHVPRAMHDELVIHPRTNRGVLKDRALAWSGAEHDWRARPPTDRRRELARIDATAEPDRVARVNSAVRPCERGCQVPGLIARTGAGRRRRAIRRDIMVRGNAARLRLVHEQLDA